MIADKSVIAVIPARGGSKGLPGKNIRELCGKPVISWTIKSALSSRYLDETMVTTDCKEIAKISRQCGASVPFLRPAALASDTASSYSVVEHTLHFYRKELGREFDYVVLLEPTSPLREPDDIAQMLEKLNSSSDRHDAIVSVGSVREHPAITKRLVGDEMQAYCPAIEQKTRRQDQEPAYFPYGVAYIVKVASLLEEKTFYPRRTTFWTIQRYQCFEIDDIYDFISIESVLSYRLEGKCDI